jgi:acetyl-CoA carboxylase carboxyl transferase subunit beta
MKDELVSILRMLMRQTPAVRGDLPPPTPEPAAEKA